MLLYCKLEIIMCLYILKPFHMVILRGEIGTVLDAIPPFRYKDNSVHLHECSPFWYFHYF